MLNVKKQFSRYAIFIVVLVFSILAVISRVSAANVSMELSSSASSVQQGSNVTVTVTLKLGSNSTLDALADLNFDSSKLQYVSASYSPSSSWASKGPEEGLSGSKYRVDVLTNGGPQSGTLGLVNVTFRALQSSGSTTLSLSNTSVSDGSVPPPAEHTVSTSGTTISFTAVPAPSPTEPSSPSAPSSPSSSNNSNTSQSSNSSNSSPTQEATPSEQEIQQNSNINDDQPVEISDDFVDQTGYIVEILVLDKDNNPKKDVEVKIGDLSAKTDEKGIAEFFNIIQGEYEVKALGKTYTFNVTSGEPTVAQQFTITEEDRGIIDLLLSIMPILLAVGALAIIGIVIYFVLKRLGPGGPSILNKHKPLGVGSKTSAKISQQNETSTMNTISKDEEDYLKPEVPQANKVIEPNKKV